ncbi:MAG: hypothetical protein U5J78_06890 [Parasphingorhabdus sp.]|nr:hypothetical protein [Parasphingorhabdus sp.]
MSYQYAKEKFADVEIIAVEHIAAPTVAYNARTFDLPPLLHILTVALYFAALGIWAIAFGARDMIITFAVCSIFLVGAFGLPLLWAKMAPAQRDKHCNFGDFLADGVASHTGIVASKDVIVQVLILPFLILCWAVITAFISAAVL